MGSFVVYRKMSAKDIREIGAETITGVLEWFKNNPRRKNCKAKVWYDQVITIRRGHEKEDVDAAANKQIALDKQESMLLTMKKPDINSIKTSGEAEQLAIDWQNWQSEQSMSWGEAADWAGFFKQLAEKFNLAIVFTEQGIL